MFILLNCKQIAEICVSSCCLDTLFLTGKKSVKMKLWYSLQCRIDVYVDQIAHTSLSILISYDHIGRFWVPCEMSVTRICQFP